MKLARPNVEYRLNDLQGMVYAACRLGAWCFDDHKHLFFTTAPHQQEYHMLLQAGGCLDAAMDRKRICPASPMACPANWAWAGSRNGYICKTEGIFW